MSEIKWTKCSERMPPDDVKMVMLRNCKEPKYISKLYAFRLPILKLLREKYEWTPYTPEAWKELKMNESYGRCPACNSLLDVSKDLGNGKYIPKTLEEHQRDRLLRPSAPLRNGKPVKICTVCYREKLTEKNRRHGKEFNG